MFNKIDNLAQFCQKTSKCKIFEVELKHECNIFGRKLPNTWPQLQKSNSGFYWTPGNVVKTKLTKHIFMILNINLSFLFSGTSI